MIFASRCRDSFLTTNCLHIGPDLVDGSLSRRRHCNDLLLCNVLAQGIQESQLKLASRGLSPAGASERVVLSESHYMFPHLATQSEGEATLAELVATRPNLHGTKDKLCAAATVLTSLVLLCSR